MNKYNSEDYFTVRERRTHKKICDNSGKCTNANVDQKFIDTIKENIITSARSLKIEETKKIKK